MFFFYVHVHVKGFAGGLNLKERYNFLAVTQEWPITESTGSITSQLHNQHFKNTFEGKIQTILEKSILDTTFASM